MQIDLYQTLKSINVSDDQAKLVVKSIEEYIGHMIAESTKPLQDKLDSTKVELGAKTDAVQRQVPDRDDRPDRPDRLCDDGDWGRSDAPQTLRQRGLGPFFCSPPNVGGAIPVKTLPLGVRAAISLSATRSVHG